MCGLYSFTRSPDEVRALFRYSELADFPPRPYVAPASPIAIVRGAQDERHFALVRWGLIPSWTKEPRPGKPLINARSETVLEKPSFRGAIRHRRCLIPADGYYEWMGDVPGKKQPYLISRPGRELFAFAGLWEHWMAADGSEIETAAIITTEANATLAPIHHRMPVVIDPENFDDWLDSERVPAKEVAPLLHPAPEDYFGAEPTVIERPRPVKKAAAAPKEKPSRDDGQMKLL